MNASSFESNLMVPDLGDVDLLIRTGGDHRISNFLLWQVAYAELVFTNTPWPDFSTKEFEKIIDGFRKVERRFGMVNNQKCLKDSVKKAEKNKKLFLSREIRGSQ